MRCEEVREQLAAYLAGELPVDVFRATQAHLAECAACRAELARVDAFAGVLAGIHMPPVPSGFASRIVATAEERRPVVPSSEQSLRRWWRLTSAPMRAAAAVAAFAVGAWGATELSAVKATEAGADNSQQAAETVVGNWFEAAPGDSFASRYLQAINSEVDGEE
jgi:anti-sigma factor RsiW